MTGPGGVARNTLLNLIGAALPLLVGLLALPIIVDGLGAERLGLLGLGWVVLGYFALLDLGMGRAATRFTAEALGRDARHEVNGIIWSAVLVQSVLGALGALLLTAVAPWLIGALRVTPPLVPEALITFRVLALAIPIVLVSASFRGGLEAARRFDLVNAVAAPGATLNYLIPMVGVLGGWGLPPILLSLVVARSLTLLAYFTLCVRLFPELLHDIRASLPALRRLASYGLWITVSFTVSPILDQLDRFLLGAFAGLPTVGYYTAPQEVVFRMRILPTALASSLFPEFAGMGGGDPRAARFYAAAIRMLLVSLVPVTIVIVFLAQDILNLWLGAAMARESSTALQWLALGLVLNAVAYIPSSYLYGINRPDLPAKFHLIELPAFLLLAWLLMPRWGAAGAGAAWAIRAGVDAILLLTAAARLGATRGVRIVTTPAAAWSVLALALLAAGFVASLSTLGGGLRLGSALGAAGVALLTAWFGLLNREERSHLVGAVANLPGLR